MKDEILEYIQKHVKEWPERSTCVRLCYDSKIMFDVGGDDDFFPDEKFNGVFIPEEGFMSMSKSYNHKEWEKKPNLEINPDNLTALIEEAKYKLDYWEGRHDALCDYQLLLKAGKAK